VVAVTMLDVGKLVLIILAPTLIGMVVLHAPKWCSFIVKRLPERGSQDPQPVGPPIQQLAADLRRLLRLHGEVTTSAHLAMRAHRLWAVESAIGVRAVEAAKALGVPHREPEMPGALSRGEMSALLKALSEAGLVLPEKVGPFISDGRY